MTKFSNTQIQGIFLLIAAALIWAPIPIPSKQTIGALIVVAIGLYDLFIK